MKTIPRLQNLSRKLRTSVTVLPRKPRPFAPQPPGRCRLREPLRLAHFNNHMLKPFSTLKKKPLKRRARVSPTSSLPVKLPYEPALQNSIVHQQHPTMHCWDMHQHLILSALPKELPLLDKGLPPGVPLLLCLSIHLDPSGSITLQTQQMSCLPVGPHPRQLLRGPLVQSGKR